MDKPQQVLIWHMMQYATARFYSNETCLINCYKYIHQQKDQRWQQWCAQCPGMFNFMRNMHEKAFCGRDLWQAELTFIRNCWYQQYELLISTIRIVDINNYNCWYQQLELLISTLLWINVNSACYRDLHAWTLWGSSAIPWASPDS